MSIETAAEAVRQSPLWDHMVKLLADVVSERPQDALSAMAATSHYHLTGNTVPPKAESAYADPRPGRTRGAAATDALHNSCWAAHLVTALAPPPIPHPSHVDAPRDEMDEAEPTGYDMRVDVDAEREAGELPGTVADVVAEQEVFNEVGVGVPPREALRLVVGLRQLVKAEPLERVRFWGKIHGTRNDYYIAEAKMDPGRVTEAEDANRTHDNDAGDGDDDEDDEDVAGMERVAGVFFAYAAKRHHATPREESGTGLNELVYYVAAATDPTSWTRLPDVTPQQICAARLVRRGFSGNLDAPVLTQPRFPGLERDYLRAQIARIHCGCRIAPRDVYYTEGATPESNDPDAMDTTAGEETTTTSGPALVPAYATVPPLLPQETPEEDDAEATQSVQAWYHGYANDELLQGKYWVHTAPTLLRSGRVTTEPVGGAAAENAAGTGEDEMDLTGVDAGGETTEMIAPFLTEVAKDEPLGFPGHSRASFPGWSFRKGFHTEANLTRVYVARSTRWPGAFTYAVTRKGKPGAQHQMVYIGSGLKNLQGVDYTPQFPPLRMREYSEEGLVLQRDCTIDEELEYAPPPPRPSADEDDEEAHDDQGY